MIFVYMVSQFSCWYTFIQWWMHPTWSRNTYVVLEYHIAVFSANHVNVFYMGQCISGGSHKKYIYMIGWEHSHTVLQDRTRISPLDMSFIVPSNNRWECGGTDTEKPHIQILKLISKIRISSSIRNFVSGGFPAHSEKKRKPSFPSISNCFLPISQLSFSASDCSCEWQNEQCSDGGGGDTAKPPKRWKRRRSFPSPFSFSYASRRQNPSPW